MSIYNARASFGNFFLVRRILEYGSKNHRGLLTWPTTEKTGLAFVVVVFLFFFVFCFFVFFFWGGGEFKIYNFNIFGVFQKNEYYWGIRILWVITKLG